MAAGGKVKYGGYATAGYYGITAANVNAFEVNGHLETGNPDNPYVETVARGLKQIFAWLTDSDLLQPKQIPLERSLPTAMAMASNLFITQERYYQGGMLMDAIIASGTPNAVTTTGGANVIGRTYKDIVQDMVDEYAWAQYDFLHKAAVGAIMATNRPTTRPASGPPSASFRPPANWGCVLHPMRQTLEYRLACL